MKAQKVQKISIEEYLALETANDTKYEYHNGQVYALAGGSINHALICGNVYTELRRGLKEKDSNCRTFNSELRLYIQSKNSFVYPGAMVVCGAYELAENEKNSITNPTLIVEVLSKSTAGYDRGDKFNFYRQIPTLQEYVLIEQEKPGVDVYYKKEGTDLWSIKSYDDLNEKISFQSLDVSVKLSDLYEDVKF